MKDKPCDPVRCKEYVARYFGGWPEFNQCSRRATRDGYCGQHHPDAVKARVEASSKRFQAKFQQRLDDEQRDSRALAAADRLADEIARLIEAWNIEEEHSTTPHAVHACPFCSTIEARAAYRAKRGR